MIIQKTLKGVLECFQTSLGHQPLDEEAGLLLVDHGLSQPLPATYPGVLKMLGICWWRSKKRSDF